MTLFVIALFIKTRDAPLLIVLIACLMTVILFRNILGINGQDVETVSLAMSVVVRIMDLVAIMELKGENRYEKV